MNKGHGPPKTADIVILGAGVMCASIAFHLAQRRPGEHHRPGQGLRGGWGEWPILRGALIRMHYSFAPDFHPALVSLRMFQQLREVVGERVTFASSASYGSFIGMKVSV